MTRTVVAVCLLTVVICLPASSEGQQYWGGNGWRQYWQPSRTENCERAYPARETNGYVRACRYPCVGIPVRYNFEEDGKPCYVDRWQPGTCYAGRCRRAWGPPAPVAASRIASTTAPETTTEAQGGNRPAQNVDGQGCPRAYPATAVRRSCRYMCQGWPFRYENEVDGTPCQLSSWREGFCYLGHCQKHFPLPKAPKDEDNNVEGNQGSTARSLKCRNYRGRETVDGTVRSCTFVCKRRKNAFLAVEDNGTPCWGWQGQRGYCDQGVCKAVEVQTSTTAAEPVPTEASATEQPPGSATVPSATDANTAAATTTIATGAPVTDPATVSATKAAVTESPAPRSPWVPGFVGVKCDRAFPAKTLDGQVTSCRYLCGGYPRLRIGFEADGTPCLKKKTTPGLCSSGYCKPLPPPTEEPAVEDESTTTTAGTGDNFSTDDFFLTTQLSTTDKNLGTEDATTLPAEFSTSHEGEVSDGTMTSVAEDILTTDAKDSSFSTDTPAAGEADFQAHTTVGVAVSTKSPGLPGGTEPEEDSPEEQSSSTDALEAKTVEGSTDRDAVGGAATASVAETTTDEGAVAASTEDNATEEHTGVDAGSVFTARAELSTSTTKGDEEAAHEKSAEGTTALPETERLADVDFRVTTPVSVEPSSDVAVETEVPVKTDSSTNTDRSAVAENHADSATEAVSTAEAAVSAAVSQSTDAFDGHTEELGAPTTSPSRDASTDSAAGVTDATNSETIAIDEEEKRSEEQPTMQHVSEASGAQEGTEESSGHSDVSVPTLEDIESVTTETAHQEQDSETGEAVSTVSSEKEQVSEANVEAGSQSTPAPEVVTVGGEAAIVVTEVATVAAEEATVAALDAGVAATAATVAAVHESTSHADFDHDFDADATTAATASATVVFVEKTSQELASEAATVAPAEATTTSLSDVREDDAKEEVSTTLPVATVTEGSTYSTTAADESATVKVITTITRKEIVRPVDPDVAQANLTSVETTRSSSVETLPASELSPATDTSVPAEAATTLSDAAETERPGEASTAAAPAAVTDESTESSPVEDESATVKVITTITRTEIVRPVGTDAAQDDATLVQKTRSTSVETLPASSSNSPTTVDSVAEGEATSADESAAAATEDTGAVSSGPHIIITDFVQKTAASSKEPVTVSTAEDQTADTL